MTTQETILKQIEELKKQFYRFVDIYKHNYVDAEGREYDIDDLLSQLEYSYEADALSVTQILKYTRRLLNDCDDIILREIISHPVPLLREVGIDGSVLVVWDDDE